MTDTVGFELEIGRNGERAVRALKAAGLTLHDRPHAKRCDCRECDPFREGSSFYVQEEVAGSVEFISKAFEYGSPKLDEAIDGLAKALDLAHASATPLRALHVHVGREGYSPDDLQRLVSLVAHHQDDLAELAAGEFSKVRHDDPSERYADVDGTVYALNRSGPECLGSDGIPRAVVTSFSAIWLHARPTTVEFRVWNASADAWRMRLALGVSVALMRAAKAGADSKAGTTLSECLSQYMNDDMGELIERQRASERSTPLPSMKEILWERERAQVASMLDAGVVQLAPRADDWGRIANTPGPVELQDERAF